MNNKVDVLIVEDHPLFRQGLREYLSRAEIIDTLKEARDGREAMDQIQKNRFDVVVMDISLPDKNGLELVKDIKIFSPKVSVLVLTMHPEDRYALRILKAGASGYLTKSNPPSDVLAAIKKVASGGLFISPSLAEELANHLKKMSDKKSAHEMLTDREFEIMSLLALGNSPVEVSQRLGISQSTVFTHRNHILEKLKLKNTYQLIYYAHSQGLIENG